MASEGEEASEVAWLLHLTDLPAASPRLHPDDSIQPQLGLLSQSFTSGSQSIGVSASASVLPVNIQD